MAQEELAILAELTKPWISRTNLGLCMGSTLVLHFEAERERGPKAAWPERHMLGAARPAGFSEPRKSEPVRHRDNS